MQTRNLLHYMDMLSFSTTLNVYLTRLKILVRNKHTCLFCCKCFIKWSLSLVPNVTIMVVAFIFFVVEKRERLSLGGGFSLANREALLIEQLTNNPQFQSSNPSNTSNEWKWGKETTFCSAQSNICKQDRSLPQSCNLTLQYFQAQVAARLKILVGTNTPAYFAVFFNKMQQW